MIELSPFIAERWNLSNDVVKSIIEHFEEGDSIYYLHDYVPSISAHVTPDLLSEIFAYLQEIKDLAPKKKRLVNTLKKADALTREAEKRIELCQNSAELDDMLISYRPNPRSRAQQALKKGLGPLADIIEAQEVEEGSLEELAEPYVGKDPSLKTVDTVLTGAKDILVERFAYEETVRSLVREFGYEDGFFEVVPKNKKDKQFAAYRGKMIAVNELSFEEFLKLLHAEKNKEIRFKHGVQLFHINELLRHHFIENPDSIAYDLLCEVIDETWSRLLQPLVERDVKERLTADAEKWVLNQIQKELQKKLRSEYDTSTTFLVAEQYSEKNIAFAAVNEKGHLLGAAEETIHDPEKEFSSNRVRQFYTRYKPSVVLVNDNEHVDQTEIIIKKSIQSLTTEISLQRYTCPKDISGIQDSDWMQQQCAVLEDAMKRVYACSLTYLQPLTLVSNIGVQHFSVHPLQQYLPVEKLEQLLIGLITEKELHQGVSIIDAPDSVLKNIPGIPEEVLGNIRKEGLKKTFESKKDIRDIEGMTEKIYRNIAGYCILVQSKNIIDRTLVHPYHYAFLEDITRELNASFESLVKEPERLRSIQRDDFAEKVFVDQNLTEQLRFAQRYPISSPVQKYKKKYRLSELQEGTVLPGRVTNITKFGVFVDINAVCEGLIHISQLTNGYIESADQVVRPNELIDVRILKVDKKKRRISLSMKKAGSNKPKIRPSQGQLNNLAKYFKDR